MQAWRCPVKDLIIIVTCYKKKRDYVSLKSSYCSMYCKMRKDMEIIAISIIFVLSKRLNSISS